MTLRNKKTPGTSGDVKSSLKGVFGCLLTDSSTASYNGLRRANDEFLKAIVRHSLFREIHFFSEMSALPAIKSLWSEFLQRYGSDKIIRFLPVQSLTHFFKTTRYEVFHQGDPYIGRICGLRDSHGKDHFPITGRAHTLSTDTHLTRTRELLLSPLKNCDAIICSSHAQQRVMKRMLAAASSSISDQIGVAIPYKGELGLIPLGIEPDDVSDVGRLEARQQLGYDPDRKIILCLGRVSPADKMDLQPLLLSVNDLVEERHFRDIQLVIAGEGDAGGEFVQSLLKQAYELNLEGCIRFELSIEDSRKQLLLAASDVFVSISDNIQESFGLAPLEAMNHGLPVVLSDWNGYRELVEDGDSGFLVDTLTSNHDELCQSAGVLLDHHAHFLQAQGTAVNINRLTNVLDRLLEDEGLRNRIGMKGKETVIERYRWEKVVVDYQQFCQQLNSEAARLTRPANRSIGLPFNKVFGHYASEVVDEEQYFKTTDRGVRVLLGSERSTGYRELAYLLDANDIKTITHACLSGDCQQHLKTLFPDSGFLGFALMWMCKYQLIEAVTDDYVSSDARFNSWVPETGEVLDKELKQKIGQAEPHRYVLIEPILVWFSDYLSRDTGQDKNSDFSVALTHHVADYLDTQLLQAITWVGESLDNNNYAEILDTIKQRGGLLYLSTSFPHWYRLHRRWILIFLGASRQLIRRFNNDLGDVNQCFSDIWNDEATCIKGIQWPQRKSALSVVILTLDNEEELIYKNRDLRLDHWITGYDEKAENIASRLNDWLGEFSGLTTYRILPREESGQYYGYAEYLPFKESGVELNESQMGDYYQRLGVISGLALMLGLGDLHHLNLVTRNGLPCLVDVQTAFHSGVFRALERELQDPAVAFIRGLDESSFEKTSLPHVWQSFHTQIGNKTSSLLTNGELLEADPYQYIPVFENLLKSGGRHSVDGIQPSLASIYGEQVNIGFSAFFAAICHHREEWLDLLNHCSGFQVRYQPIVSGQSMGQQLSDIYQFRGFQNFSKNRVKQYFSRMGVRITLAGEEVQRWLESSWKEPVSLLDESLSRSWMLGLKPDFIRQLGDVSVYSRESGLSAVKLVAGDFFRRDSLELSIELFRMLADDELKRTQFVDGMNAVILRWIEEQLIPGKNTPDSIRQYLTEK